MAGEGVILPKPSRTPTPAPATLIPDDMREREKRYWEIKRLMNEEDIAGWEMVDFIMAEMKKKSCGNCGNIKLRSGECREHAGLFCLYSNVRWSGAYADMLENYAVGLWIMKTREKKE